MIPRIECERHKTALNSKPPARPHLQTVERLSGNASEEPCPGLELPVNRLKNFARIRYVLEHLEHGDNVAARNNRLFVKPAMDPACAKQSSGMLGIPPGFDAVTFVTHLLRHLQEPANRAAHIEEVGRRRHHLF